MTNEQQQAIEAAARQYVKPIRHQLPLGGEESVVNDFIEGTKEILSNPEKYGFQPVNQWIKIKPDGSNLSKTSGKKYKLFLEDGSIEENDINYSLYEIHAVWKITHYKLIEEDKPPTDVEPK